MDNEQLQKCLDDGMSFRHIAAMFGVTLGTIAGRAHRLKQRKLRQQIVPQQQIVPRKPKAFNTEARTTTAVVPRYIQRPPKSVELTKSELREVLRQALVNTSRM